MEIALKESEYFLNSLIENLSVGILIIDPITRNIETINSYATELIGSNAENIIGNRCHGFVCPAMEKSCPICDLNQIVDSSDKILLRNDGEEIPI